MFWKIIFIKSHHSFNIDFTFLTLSFRTIRKFVSIDNFVFNFHLRNAAIAFVCLWKKINHFRRKWLFTIFKQYWCFFFMTKIFRVCLSKSNQNFEIFVKHFNDCVYWLFWSMRRFHINFYFNNWNDFFKIKNLMKIFEFRKFQISEFFVS